MKELQVFKNKEFGQVRVIERNNTKTLLIDDEEIDKFKLLALASKIGIEDEEAAFNLLNIASILYHPEDDFAFNELYGAVATEIVRNNIEREADIHCKFNKNVNKIFGANAKVVKIKNNARHIPDAWVDIDGEKIPVEIKLNKFGKNALIQLQRYMHFYKCAHGIAVAKKLTVKLPNNIIFISIDELED